MATEITYRPVGRLVIRRIGKDNLLVPVSGAVATTNAVFPLNDTGLFIWEHLSSGKSVTQTAAELSRAFSVTFAAAVADCQEYAGKLLAEKLLEGVPS